MDIGRIRTLTLVLGMCLASLSLSAQVQPATLEYWFDRHFDARQSIPMDGVFDRTLQVGQLRDGLHTMEMRVKDSQGLWGIPQMKYFLVTRLVGGDNQVSACRYWIDDAEQTKEVAVSGGQVLLEIDVASLRKGIHTFCCQLTDNYGHAGAPQLAYFLVPDVTHVGDGDNQVSVCRYWIDDAEQTKEVAVSGGQVLLEIDVTSLRKGIHTFCCQLTDNYGHAGAPQLAYFLVPDIPEFAENIAAYEYWFNSGERVRVDVTPQNPFSADNLLVEVKDVIPNQIPDDYWFDVAEETVYCRDQVSFGLQVVDDLGSRSQAVVAEKFDYVVPVDPHCAAINDGESDDLSPLASGTVQGYKTECEAGDILIWTVDGSAVKFDVYESDGSRAECEVVKIPTGQTEYRMEAKTTQVYALAYQSAVLSVGNIISLTVQEPSGIRLISDGFRLSTGHNSLRISTEQGGKILITDVSGRLMVNGKITKGQHEYMLPQGLYIVSVEGHQPVKAVVR